MISLYTFFNIMIKKRPFLNFLPRSFDPDLVPHGLMALNSEPSSRPGVGPTKPWVQGALTPEIKRQGHEADHSLPYSAEVKKAWSYTSTLLEIFMACRLIKQWMRYHGVILS
jgi:hypothetical protein